MEEVWRSWWLLLSSSWQSTNKQLFYSISFVFPINRVVISFSHSKATRISISISPTLPLPSKIWSVILSRRSLFCRQRFLPSSSSSTLSRQALRHLELSFYTWTLCFNCVQWWRGSRNIWMTHKFWGTNRRSGLPRKLPSLYNHQMRCWVRDRCHSSRDLGFWSLCKITILSKKHKQNHIPSSIRFLTKCLQHWWQQLQLAFSDGQLVTRYLLLQDLEF